MLHCIIQSVLVGLLLAVILIIISNFGELKDQFRSYCWRGCTDCDSTPPTSDYDLSIINPTLRPYTFTQTPELTTAPDTNHLSISSETDHSEMSS